MRNERILSYVHCKSCLNGRLAFGWTNEGFILICEDCNKPVLDIDFKGQKIEQFKGR